MEGAAEADTGHQKGMMAALGNKIENARFLRTDKE